MVVNCGAPYGKNVMKFLRLLENLVLIGCTKFGLVWTFTLERYWPLSRQDPH